MLKDVYAYWLANLLELQPRGIEEATANQGYRYKLRTDLIFKTYKEKEERLSSNSDSLMRR
jgi:hypothetical protein